MTKENKTVTVNEAASEGVSLEALKESQTGLTETTSEPVVRPADIAGVSNNPTLDNSELTAKLAQLEHRFNVLADALHGTHFDQKF